MILSLLTVLLLAPLAALNADQPGVAMEAPRSTWFAPDLRIKPDDNTVLMAADGQNPGEEKQCQAHLLIRPVGCGSVL